MRHANRHPIAMLVRVAASGLAFPVQYISVVNLVERWMGLRKEEADESR